MNYRTVYHSALINAIYWHADRDAAIELIRRMQAFCTPASLIEFVQALRKRSGRIPPMRLLLAELNQAGIQAIRPLLPNGVRLTDIVISDEAHARLALIAERHFDADLALTLESMILAYEV